VFSMGRSRAVVIAFALAGLVLVAGVTYLASRLVSQPIGLASEPATLGRSLAPVTGTPTSTTPQTTTRTVTTTTAPATTTQAAPDADDHGGQSDADGDDD
jgi:hypothetical protein